MKQMVMEGDTPYLPQEIITNILKRLPVKSLIRFQSVCKHWKDLFKTQSFIEDHLHHATHQNPLILFQQNSIDPPLNLDLLDCDMRVHEVQCPPLNGSYYDVYIVGSSNGLLCLELEEYDIYPPSLLLWNPAIREVRQVPRTVNYFKSTCYLGFGFSPIVNDYKIVRIYETSLGNANDVTRVNRVEVYSLFTGSWKQVKFGNLDGVSFDCDAITANGTVFWIGHKLNYCLVVSFDIAKEVFTLITMPSLCPWRIGNENLTVYENKLAVISYYYERDYKYPWIENKPCLINLWVMEEGTYASKERWVWTKKYTINPFPCMLSPMTIWRNEIVCKHRKVENCEGKHVIYLFNLTTNEIKNFPIGRCSKFYGIFDHVESLASIGNIHIKET